MRCGYEAISFATEESISVMPKCPRRRHTRKNVSLRPGPIASCAVWICNSLVIAWERRCSRTVVGERCRFIESSFVKVHHFASQSFRFVFDATFHPVPNSLSSGPIFFRGSGFDDVQFLLGILQLHALLWVFVDLLLETCLDGFEHLQYNVSICLSVRDLVSA